jgi:AcrR family transcriptional regulator
MAKHQPPEARRAQLFRAAMEVCSAKGYHATRVEDIAARAGLSKGSIYHHFRSKKELFLALLEGMIVEIKQGMRAALAATPSAAEGIRLLVRQVLASSAAEPEVVQGMMEFYLLGLREPGFRASFLHHYEDMVAIGADFVRRGIATGEFRPDLDPERVAWLFFTAGDGLIFVHAVIGQTARGLELMLDHMELFLAGLARRPEVPR